MVHTEEVNCAPLSEVKVAGTPNLDIQVKMKAFTQASVEIDDKVTTTGQGVVLSIIVRCLSCLLVQGGELLNKADVRGL